MSRADAPSVVISEIELGGIAVSADEPLVVPFTLDVEDALLEPRATYVLAAHVDLTRSGTVTAGDYITTESLPAPRARSSASVQIPVHEVT